MNDNLNGLPIEFLLENPVVQKLDQAMNAVADIQRGLYAFVTSDDSEKLKWQKIGTAFQLFLIDTLASGKTVKDLSEDDWRNIAEKNYHNAILEDEQTYSEFVFEAYANYIAISADTLSGRASEESIESIKSITESIRHNSELLRNGTLSESDYVEACLWLSLEAMIKLLSSSLTVFIGPEYTHLVEALTQLGFEYGRHVLYAKEQAILEQYLENQHILDEQLQKKYEEYLAEVQEQADEFQKLIDNAFSANIQDTLLQSAELARAAGVKEDELLLTVEDVDDYFMI